MANIKQHNNSWSVNNLRNRTVTGAKRWWRNFCSVGNQPLAKLSAVPATVVDLSNVGNLLPSFQPDEFLVHNSGKKKFTTAANKNTSPTGVGSSYPQLKKQEHTYMCRESTLFKARGGGVKRHCNDLLSVLDFCAFFHLKLYIYRYAERRILGIPTLKCQNQLKILLYHQWQLSEAISQRD